MPRTDKQRLSRPADGRGVHGADSVRHAVIALCVCIFSCWAGGETSATLEGVQIWPAVCFFGQDKYDRESVHGVPTALLSLAGWLKTRRRGGRPWVGGKGPQIYWGFLGESKFPFVSVSLGGWRRK